MQSIKTLLADDHALIRAGLRDALADLDELEIVGEVGNGHDLMQALDSLQPDLLVMDVNMPDFEPVSAVREILSKYPQLKILVVSAYDDETYVTGLLSAGVRGYHLKDQPLSDLHLAIQRILDNGRWISDPLVSQLVHHRVEPTAETGAAMVLTRRQRELLYLLTQGYNNQKIALLMDLSVKTVENHLTSLYRALGVESRLEATKFASQHPELLAISEIDTRRKGNIQHEGAVAVLLVDDNPRYRAQLGKLLNRACPSLCFYEAEDTKDACRLAEQIKPQLAFVDVVLRDEDGIQCTRRIKAISPVTRIVLISAYPDREFRRIGLNAGAVAFLDKKDIDAATIRQVVEDALSI